MPRSLFFTPMKKPGNLASDGTSSDSLNDAAVYVIDADTSAATSEVVIEGMSDDLITKLRVDDVEAWGNTDGGFDIKAPDAVLTGCIARENKRNFRVALRH